MNKKDKLNDDTINHFIYICEKISQKVSDNESSLTAKGRYLTTVSLASIGFLVSLITTSITLNRFQGSIYKIVVTIILAISYLVFVSFLLKLVIFTVVSNTILFSKYKEKYEGDKMLYVEALDALTKIEAKENEKYGITLNKLFISFVVLIALSAIYVVFIFT